jgi:hypothetical protein
MNAMPSCVQDSSLIRSWFQRTYSSVPNRRPKLELHRPRDRSSDDDED